MVIGHRAGNGRRVTLFADQRIGCRRYRGTAQADHRDAIGSGVEAAALRPHGPRRQDDKVRAFAMSALRAR